MLLAAAEDSGEVTRLARRLRRERSGSATVFAELVTAGACARSGDPAAAGAALLAAEAAALASDMQLCEQVARRRRGEILGGSEGAALVADADAWMNAHGISDPDAIARVYAPGF